MRYRRRPRVRAAAWSLAGFTLLELTATMVLIVLNAGRAGTGRAISEVILAVAAGLYAGAGLLITRRLPANAAGWLLSVIGLSLAAALLAEQYALYGLAAARGSLPGAGLVGWGAGILAYLTVLLLFCLFLLFPDGRLPSPAWRPVLWAVFVVMAGAAAQTLQAGTKIGGLTGALPAAHAGYPNPLGIFPRHGWFGGLVAVIYVLAVLTAALSVASVFARRRRASAELRKQLAWLGYDDGWQVIWESRCADRLPVSDTGPCKRFPPARRSRSAGLSGTGRSTRTSTSSGLAPAVPYGARSGTGTLSRTALPSWCSWSAWGPCRSC